jgi:hypothetical protein
MQLEVAMPADKECGDASLLYGEGTTSSFGRIPQHLLLLGVRRVLVKSTFGHQSTNATLGFVKVSFFHIWTKTRRDKGHRTVFSALGNMFPLMPPPVSRLVVCRFVWANPGAAHTAIYGAC